MKLTRNQFLKVALASAAGVSALACGDDDDTTSSNGPGPGAGGGGVGGQSTGGEGTGGMQGGGCSESISINHGHSIVVSDEDVAAGVDKTYNIQGTSDHDHEVTVTAADFATLQGGGMVTIESTLGGDHNHSVTISC